MLHGVKIVDSTAQKDELILEGNDIDNVSQSGSYDNTAKLTSFF
jgi:large subunit ribosomal protein L9e